MRLRIRSMESKEALKIETPPPFSLQTLKDAIAEKISVPPETLIISLNRKDTIDAAPHESLNSLGITSGDLIFYSLRPNNFSEATTYKPPQTSNHQVLTEIETPKALDQPKEDKLNSSDDTMEEGPDDVDVPIATSSSVPCLLRKILMEESVGLEEEHKLLTIAVHAVFLESGFVGFDQTEQKKIDGFHLPLGWASNLVPLSLQYTVPPLLGRCVDGVETVVLRFQILGKFLNVRGSLSKNGVGWYKLCLDGSQIAPSIRFVQSNQVLVESMDNKDRTPKSFHEKEVFEFWKIVKDEIALPLLIDLCVKSGLEPPPCFLCLPTDLKLRILEYLPGDDIARASCVNTELRYIASHNDLWKQKFSEEFGSSLKHVNGYNWKDKFIGHWERRKSCERARRERFRRPLFHPRYEGPVFVPRRRYPFGFPRIIGGDHDMFPPPYGSRRTIQFGARTMSISPPCHLDEI
ncbi:hypothetical protein Syun_014573 [Stephania yunnanensis]|uniref:F-box domain-containing protein n=1 Tax=Stephania yunnanensis TaxID=152371 RepID=A0AAP0JLB8_9MAGN